MFLQTTLGTIIFISIPFILFILIDIKQRKIESKIQQERQKKIEREFQDLKKEKVNK